MEFNSGFKGLNTHTSGFSSIMHGRRQQNGENSLGPIMKIGPFCDGNAHGHVNGRDVGGYSEA